MSPSKLSLVGVRVERVRPRFPPLCVVADLTFDVSEHQLVAFVGPSGCGKTTILHVIAGIDTATSGQVLFKGQEITGPSRERGLVSQQYSLFPWLTVEQNIFFGANCGSDLDPKAIEHEVEGLLARADLTAARNLYPAEISGGMRQRTAIARTLAADPEILLLDEPFGALDAITRASMQALLVELFNSMKQSVILVTHDVEEAVKLSDRVYVLSDKPTKIIRSVNVPSPRSDIAHQILRGEKAALAEGIYSTLGSLQHA